MARAGDELVNPVTGLRTVFRRTARETDGELLRVDWIGDPGWTTGPDHVHPLQEERFEVLSGRLGLRVGGVERVLEEGEAIVAPAGSAHAAWNAGDDTVHALVDFRPALRTETAFETLAGLAREGKTNGAGAPKNPLLLALVLHEYEDEIYFVKPPLAVQRVVFGLLAKVARLLGYRAEHPYPYARQSEASRTVNQPDTGTAADGSTLSEEDRLLEQKEW
jgi:quercetin dioxygenase-like cupin family protein